MNADESSVVPRLQAWVIPALRSAIALGLCVTGLALVIGSMILWLVSGAPSIAAAGLLGGAMTGTVGALLLFWSLRKPAAS